jgi:Cu+-exporting ATPase
LLLQDLAIDFIDANIAFNVFTAVLIVACPCALALTAPFTFGNVLRILGKQKFYLKMLWLLNN